MRYSPATAREDAPFEAMNWEALAELDFLFDDNVLALDEVCSKKRASDFVKLGAFLSFFLTWNGAIL